MMRGVVFLLVLSWPVFIIPALSQNLSIPSMADNDIGAPDNALQGGADRVAALCQMIKAAAFANDISAGFYCV